MELRRHSAPSATLEWWAWADEGNRNSNARTIPMLRGHCASPWFASAGAVSTRECTASTSSAHRVLRRAFYTLARRANNGYAPLQSSAAVINGLGARLFWVVNQFVSMLRCSLGLGSDDKSFDPSSQKGRSLATNPGSPSARNCPGKVYLVGAGPGPVELLTLRAAELLRDADVVVYDRLIQEGMLALTSSCAELIPIGKPVVGCHSARQNEVNELLVKKAREGKQVVRLKGGDPFVLGRGGEEAAYLAERGVPFEVIPGVSSAIAAPLHAGIPLTHRDIASCVVIATGHEAHRDEDRLDWAALSKLDTLVFLMGVRNLGRIASRLIEHGRDPATPAALIQMAYWPDERVLVATLANIAQEAERAQLQPPATLVIGEVVRWRERLRIKETSQG